MKLIRKRKITSQGKDGEVRKEIKEEVVEETKSFSLRLRNKIKSKAEDVKDALEDRNESIEEANDYSSASEQNTFHKFKRNIHKRHLRDRLDSQP